MTLEETLYAVLSQVADTYPDRAPVDAALPYVVWQRTGGRALAFMDRSKPPLAHSTIQVNGWAASAVAVSQLMENLEAALLASDAVTASALSQPQSIFDDDPNATLRGRMQDFSIWHPV
ncbi:DUF3168 domain-containing protein [Parasalinivibrio latis]|uniref:tail completion protein gp17 n=1 Tax=Parasalinivibrio latis TaxID=2952610 RepID=UPI0030E1C409